MKPDAAEPVAWREGRVPVSPRFDDPYYSIHDGLAESRHVFLAGNGLPERARGQQGFTIAELGFGTGLNLCATAHALQNAGIAGPVRYASFEAFPIAADDMARALAAFADVAPQAAVLLAAWRRGARRFTLGPVAVEIIEGDANATLPGWDGQADAWFLDGFAPARNPELWRPELMRAVAAHSRPGATLATYSAARAVREALAAAGFEIERVPGFGAKRHMTVGRLAGGGDGRQ